MSVMATPERNLKAFDWLPLERWDMNTVCGPRNGLDIYCKICDEWVNAQSANTHVGLHVGEATILGGMTGTRAIQKREPKEEKEPSYPVSETGKRKTICRQCEKEFEQEIRKGRPRVFCFECAPIKGEKNGGTT